MQNFGDSTLRGEYITHGTATMNGAWTYDPIHCKMALLDSTNKRKEKTLLGKTE